MAMTLSRDRAVVEAQIAAMMRPPASDGEASRYDSLLESNFGPPPAVAREVNGTRKQSKTRRNREEKHKIAALTSSAAAELKLFLPKNLFMFLNKSHSFIAMYYFRCSDV